MALSPRFIWFFCSAVITLAFADPKLNGHRQSPVYNNFHNNKSNSNENNKNNGNHQEFKFSSDPANPALNSQQSELPLMYRSLVKNSNPELKSTNILDQQKQDSNDKPKSLPPIGSNQHWPNKSPKFSDPSKSQNDKASSDSSKSSTDQSNWQSINPSAGHGNSESNSQMPQFFETPASPSVTSGSTAAKKGVAFWPRDFKNPNASPLPTKSRRGKKVTKVSSKENTDRVKNAGSNQRSKNHPENDWANKQTARPTEQIRNGSFANFVETKRSEVSKLNNNKLKEEPKRATSEFSPRDDFTSTQGKNRLEFPEVKKEPQPPISVMDSEFELPESKKNRVGGYEKNKPHVPMIDMSTGMADDTSVKSMTEMIRRKGPGDSKSEAASDMDDRRRWSQDSPDRIKEFRNNLRNKHGTRRPATTLHKTARNRVQMPINGPSSPSEAMKNSRNQNRVSKNKNIGSSSSQPWSTLSIAQRRINLSTRLAELMSKNRVERRARLFGPAKIKKTETTKEKVPAETKP